MDKKEQIQELISLGKTEEALELLEQLTSDAVLLQSRFNGAKRQYSMGMIDFSEWSRTQAQINYAALEMMNGMKPKPVENAVKPVNQQNTEVVAKKIKEPAKPRVFISYNQKDSFVMRTVKENLEKNDIETFVDINEIGVGDDIQERIERGLKRCKIILSLISENSLRSGWVNTEISTALVLRNYGKKWLPVLLDKKHLEPAFYNMVMDEFEKYIQELNQEIATAASKGRPVNAFVDRQKRAMDLRNDFGETIQALGRIRGQDISNNDFFEDAMKRVVKAIKG